MLDAGVGTRLVALGLRLDCDDPALWNRTDPDAVAAMHALDLAAGADAVLTNTFGAHRLWLARWGLAGEAPALNRRACQLARAAAGPGRYVLGAIGPAGVGDPAGLREQAEALVEGGVDALVFETQRAGEIVTALAAVGLSRGVPVVVSLFDWPDPVGEVVRRLEDLGVSALGVNCVGLDAAGDAADRLGRATRLPLWVKPSSGPPGGPTEGADAFAAAVPAFLASGARFLGGCCGTTEAHVAAIYDSCYDSWAKFTRAGG